MRIFNYSGVDVLRVDELIVPPALLSLSIGTIHKKLIENGEKVNFADHCNLTLTGAATLFQEEVLSEFLENIVKLIEQPLSISL